MSLHINRFVDRIKAAESQQQRNVTLTIAEARDLHADITKLLLVLQTLQQQSTTATSEEKLTLEVDGGTF
jgi:hypothetical protein